MSDKELIAELVAAIRGLLDSEYQTAMLIMNNWPYNDPELREAQQTVNKRQVAAQFAIEKAGL